jgi:hypothetical protein
VSVRDRKSLEPRDRERLRLGECFIAHFFELLNGNKLANYSLRQISIEKKSPNNEREAKDEKFVIIKRAFIRPFHILSKAENLRYNINISLR